MRRFTVWCPALGHDARRGEVIEALTPRDAATSWAQRSDAWSTEYEIAKGESATVVVRADDGYESTWIVVGEMVANYVARRATPNASNQPAP